MRLALRALAALTLGLAASPALAVDTSFYTYDGFAETVDALRVWQAAASAAQRASIAP